MIATFVIGNNKDLLTILLTHDDFYSTSFFFLFLSVYRVEWSSSEKNEKKKMMIMNKKQFMCFFFARDKRNSRFMAKIIWLNRIKDQWSYFIFLIVGKNVTDSTIAARCVGSQSQYVKEKITTIVVVVAAAICILLRYYLWSIAINCR